MTARNAALLLFVTALHVGAVAQAPSPVRRISLDFPHGELRLLVDRDGPSQLFYAAAPFGREVVAGTFDIDTLRGPLTSRLLPVTAAETHPVGQLFGTVSLWFAPGKTDEYLIADQAFAEGLLQRACANLTPDTASSGALVASACARLRTRTVTSARARQDMPPPLAALVGRARLDGPVAAWCAAQYRPGAAGAMAVAVTAPGGGRYLALDADGNVSALAAFASTPDLACYTRAAAEDLHRSIKTSDTIQGEITPRFDTTVVCGFVDDTSARCWQYAPETRTFVVVGRWVT
jgi:hypothetical protein